jgi:hypothetical protein
MLLLPSLPDANSGLPPTPLTLRGLCDCGDGQKRKAVKVSKKLVERKPVRWRSEPVGEQQGKPGEPAICSCLLLPSGRFQLILPAGTIDRGLHTMTALRNSWCSPPCQGLVPVDIEMLSHGNIWLSWGTHQPMMASPLLDMAPRTECHAQVCYSDVVCDNKCEEGRSQGVGTNLSRRPTWGCLPVTCRIPSRQGCGQGSLAHGGGLHAPKLSDLPVGKLHP